MYRILKAGFLFFLIFLIGLFLSLSYVAVSFDKNCLETEASETSLVK